MNVNKMETEALKCTDNMVVSTNISENLTVYPATPAKSSSTNFQKYHKQAYRTSWESIPEFKDWLKGVENQPSRAYCSYCQVTLFAHRLSLLKHTCTRKHQKAAHKMFLQTATKVTGSADGLDNQTEINGVLAAHLDECVESKNDEMDDTLETIQGLGSGVQLQLKSKPSPVSGMTVTIIRDHGTSGSLHLEVSDEDNDSVLCPESSNNLNMNRGASVDTSDKSSSSTMPPFGGSPITTHVLDTSRGAPVSGINVSLYRLIDGRWTLVNESITSPDGRCNELIGNTAFINGRYKLHFDVDRYFELQRQETMYPFVEIVFDVHSPQAHYHIPLLLSPFGYTTYRGS